ncbi:Arm DNA-binding domain-containing protein [Variovorax sp. VaC1]|uniref:Arm DNA-binding domain-containing protein n=1 Tax=Variovorax sp. VaC1 TaxID=3373132 RepID=UPI00374786DA
MSVGITVIKRTNKEVIRVACSFQGVQCRKTLDLPGTRENLRYAERLRGEILRKIEHSTFRYDEYFPSPPKCKVFGHGKGKGSDVSIKQLQEGYRDRSKASLQPSTWSGYSKAINNVLISQFGHIQVGALSASTLREWIGRSRISGSAPRKPVGGYF